MKAIQTANSKGGSLRFNLKNNHYIKLLSNINRTGLFSAFTFLLLALTCLFPISKGEQNTEAVTGTAQSSSLTLNVSSAAASVEFDVNSTDGTFASSSSDNSAAFSVVTNNFSGYTLSISGSDNDGKLYDTTKKYFLEPLTSAVSEADFSSTSSLNGKWGYKPSKFNSAVNSNYLPAPTTTTSTLDTTSVANTTENNYTISLGLRAGYDTVANTYSNAFIITAVPNPIAYVITYDANTTDTVSNMPAAQNSTTSATKITLSDKTPAREGYDFKGWCTVAPTKANPETCVGITFLPSSDYNIDQTTENITTLYAMWRGPLIQDYTYSRCSTEAVNVPVTLVDKRDGKEYTVRHINGNCWMTQNLKIDKGQVMTPEDTNIASNYTMPHNDLTAGDSYTEARMHEESKDATGNWYNYCAATAGTICDNSNSTEAIYDICPKGWKLPTNDDQIALNGDTNNFWNSNYPTSFDLVAAGYYKGGSLSNFGSHGYWWSSTANGDTYRQYLYYDASGGLISGIHNGRFVGFSIRCVRARVPGITISFNANGGTGSMETQKINSGQSAKLTANAFVRTGYNFTSWNTKADGTGVAYANIDSYTAPVSEDSSTITLYAQWEKALPMQTYTDEQCSTDASSWAMTLTDTRDNKFYTVRYINGRCWMTQNLNFALISNMILSHDTTNVSSDITLGTVGSLDSGNSYDEPRISISSNSSYGAYYNYAAATAGTITGDSNTAEATQDICPKGWKLPTNNEQWILNNSYIITSGNPYNYNYPKEFMPVMTDRYFDGSLSGWRYYGYWWSSTAGNDSGRYILRYYGDPNGNGNGNSNMLSGYNDSRSYGLSVRCVLK